MATGPTTRRVGAETSKTRDRILDRVERIMVEQGYPGVTYRAVAAAADVTSSLVQYYFPTLDDLFVAAIRRRGDQNLVRITTALAERAGEPLRVLWEFSQEESTAALTTEYLALGNHRVSVRSEIAAVTERVRKVQVRAVEERHGTIAFGDTLLSPPAFVFLLTGVPRLVRIEQRVGTGTAHADAVRELAALVDRIEPARNPLVDPGTT